VIVYGIFAISKTSFELKNYIFNENRVVNYVLCIALELKIKAPKKQILQIMSETKFFFAQRGTRAP